ncbi:MAG: hypothetical protein JXA69_07520 [Phycisphaerae bacterium]|nr:hypothetical protein [Phycisphaerae bacterium]
MYLEIHVDRRRRNPYVYGLFRETFRDNGKVRHRTRGRVTGLSHRQLQAMRDFVQQGCPEDSGHRYEIKDSREFGAVCAVLHMAEALGVDRLLYSRRKPWVRHALVPLFEQDGEGAARRWTFAGVLERLKGLRQETLVFDQTEVTLKTRPDDEQQRILDLLGVRL